MHKDKTLSKIDKMSPSERVQLASSKCLRLIDLTIDLIQTNGNNEVIYFSPLLAEQIPHSRGAHAFNNMQHCMFMHEIVRLCAIWDSEDFEKDNIPTIIALLDDSKTTQLLYQRHLRSVYLDKRNTRIYDEDVLEPETVEAFQSVFHLENIRRTKKSFLRRLRVVSCLGRGVINSGRLATLAEFRHSYLAHNIDRDLKLKVGGGGPIKMPKTGHPKKLLRTTCQVINAINFLARNAYFDFDESVKIARRNAERLWGACKFDGVT